jgi:hypothetical protein
MVTTRNNASGANKRCLNREKQLRKDQDRVVQKRAFNDLLVRRGTNNGKLKFGDLEKVVQEYQNMGFTSVTRRNLRYRLDLLDNHGSTSMVSELERPTQQVITNANVTEVSSLTEPGSQVVGTMIETEPLIELEMINETETDLLDNNNTGTVSGRGRKKVVQTRLNRSTYVLYRMQQPKLQLLLARLKIKPNLKVATLPPVPSTI